MFKACKDGDLLKLIQASNGDPSKYNTIDKRNGHTPLIASVTNNHTELVTYLLSQNVDINVADYSGMTALMYAISEGRQYFVDQILDYKPILEISISGSALILAISLHQNISVISLIRLGANVNHKGLLDDTPLMNAVASCNDEAVKILIHNDAEINDKNWFHRTALDKLDDQGYEADFIIQECIIGEYRRYFMKIKGILKYLGLENVYCVTRMVTEEGVKDEILMNTVYE